MEGTGKLILVVGASGAGKDTLIQWAARSVCHSLALRVIEREITRARGPLDHHVEVEEADFAARSAAGAYLLTWSAHGVDYGLPRAAATLMRDGISVLSIASRTMLEPARSLPFESHFVEVRAPHELLLQRLATRDGRDRAEIPGRIARASSFPVDGPDVHVVDNAGALADSGAAFNALLREIVTG